MSSSKDRVPNIVLLLQAQAPTHTGTFGRYEKLRDKIMARNEEFEATEQKNIEELIRVIEAQKWGADNAPTPELRETFKDQMY